MSDSQTRKKDKNQHIQVFVRVRPANQAEINGKSSTVVEVASSRDCVVRERPQDKHTKKFTFDRVFGPASKQLDVYNAVVSPLLDEVLAGYNCTVFAYGQTGTGKTFTMEGLSNDPAIHWQSDTTAGIIPRALSHLFDELRMMESQEYTVRVSFLELYNEELFDLLSPNDDASKIRLYEDATKKGAVIIHGLEEVTVHNKNEVYKILEKGSEKRQTAATLMNAHSSRSHTVFSITVHIKENTVDGEELLKTGKLNLVDLAGSENVGRSGAVDRRAREAGNINQSLLTLGRVITALVERAPHIPYRESKLTRLLQESLGGRTKTSIIATVSPASVNLEETLSTLDYAHRAKNITNRPEINQKLSKKALLKEYTEEIERLRRDLAATRERNGVYLAADNYNEMQSQIEFQEKEIEEKINHIKVLEETMASKEQLLIELKIDLENTKHKVVVTQQERDVQRFLVERHVHTEKKLLKQAKTLLDVAETATVDTYKLHDKIQRKSNVEMENVTIGDEFKANIAQQFDNIQNDLSNYTEELMEFYSSSKDEIVKQTNNNSKFFAGNIQSLSRDLIKEQKCVVDDLTNNIKASYKNYEKWFIDEIDNATSMTDYERDALKKIAAVFAPKISNLVRNNIDENLRIINEETTEQLINLRDSMKNHMETLVNQCINERNLLKKEIELMSKDFKTTQKLNEESIAEENEFTVLCENYRLGLLKLQEKRVKRRVALVDSSKSGLDKCKTADLQVEKLSTLENKMGTLIRDNLYKDVTSMSEKLSIQLDDNRKLSQTAIEQSEIINSELINELENNCEYLSTYKNKFETQTNKYKRCIDTDLNKTLSSIANEYKILVDATKYHEEQMENHRKKFESNFIEMNNKFDEQNSNTIDWSGKINMHLSETKNKIEQFLDVDLKRDSPTGSTPAKKDFSYPRQLIMTSPHERLVQRYRQMNPSVTITSDNQFESFSTSTINDESTLICSPSNQTIHNKMQYSTPNVNNSTVNDCLSTSVPTNNNQIKYCTDITSQSMFPKSASVSDLSAFVNNDATTTVMDNSIAKSESEIFNKENSGDNEINNSSNGGFAKPSLRQPKYGMKTRTANSNSKRILSSRNE